MHEECKKKKKKREEILCCVEICLTPFFFSRYSRVFSQFDYRPAVNRVQSVVSLITGDGEDSKLHPLFLFNSSPSPHLKPLRNNEPLVRDGFSSILWETVLSVTSRSVSSPCYRPLCTAGPRRTPGSAEETSSSHPSGCRLRLLFSLSSSAAGCD